MSTSLENFADDAVDELALLDEPATQTVDSRPTPAPNSIVRGSVWTIAGYGAGQVLRLAGNILVSRLVAPDCFGIMAIVNVVLQGLGMFSDVGIEPSIIQHRRGDELTFRNTAWTIQVLRGWGLLLGATLLAWPVAEFYHEPTLRWLIPIAGLTSLISGLNSTALFTVRRHLQLGRLTALDLVSQTVGVSTMCLWAWVEPSVVAMMVGAIATSLVTMIGSHFLIAGPRNRLGWDRAAAHDLFHFGKWVFVSTVITFLAIQIDRMLLGKLVAMHELGVYSVAAAVATLPNILLGLLTGAVLYPVLSHYARQSHQAMLAALQNVRHVMLTIGAFFVLGVICEAPTFFSLVYDDRYRDAGWIAQLLAIAVWVMLLSTTADRALHAVGDPRGAAKFNFCKLLATLAATGVGYGLGGLSGFIGGLAVGALAGHAVLAYRLAQHGFQAWRQDLLFTVGLATVASLTYSLGQWAERSQRFGHELVCVPVLLVAGLCCWRQLRVLRRLV